MCEIPGAKGIPGNELRVTTTDKQFLSECTSHLNVDADLKASAPA